MAILNIHKTNGIGVQTSAVQRIKQNFNEIIIVNAESLNVRSGPSTDYTTLGTVSTGEIFEVIEVSNNWYHIQYTEEKDGWVLGDYVEYTTYNAPSLTINETTKVQGFYPVGSLYFSINSTNPTEYFGGTWELFGPGRTIVGVDEDDTSFSTTEKTGGEKTHTLTVSELAAHHHQWKQLQDAKSGTAVHRMRASVYDANVQPYHSSYVGGGQPHQNMQPYRTCYIWKRTA